MSDLVFTITPSAYNRIEDMRSQRGEAGLYLRVAVSGGGCSGFKYDMNFDAQVLDDDIVLDDCVVIDPVSAGFLQGAQLDYSVSLMGEAFKIVNPNATSGCGCGESFSV